MSGAQVGAGCGAVAALGLLLVVSAAPQRRRPRLDARLGPYVSDAPRPSRLLVETRTLTPFPTLERLLRPVLRDGVGLLDRVLGGTATVRRQLDQAGRGMTVEEFRAEQIIWGAAGLLVGVLLTLVAMLRPHPPATVPLLLMCLCLTLGGVLGRDRWLAREVAQREQRMLAEFPTVAELLALAVAAGESPTGALDRVTRLSSGELAKELCRALGDARAGASLVHALDGIATRTSIAALARFVDGIAIAVERGTPLADVLRAQAVDVREAGKRALLEASGKKEIGMMVPVVFLILPVTVLFLLYPGFYSLSFTVR